MRKINTGSISLAHKKDEGQALHLNENITEKKDCIFCSKYLCACYQDMRTILVRKWLMHKKSLAVKT